jgi:ribosomal protein S19
MKIKQRYEKINVEDIGKVFNVYNGKDFTVVKIQSRMTNHRFGEFSKTRKTMNKRIK